MLQDLVGNAAKLNRLWAEASSQSHTGEPSSLLGDATPLELKRQLCLAFLLLHKTQEPLDLGLSQREAMGTLQELSRALLERKADSLHVAAADSAIRYGLDGCSASYRELAKEAQDERGDETMALRWEITALEKDVEDGRRLDNDETNPERWQKLSQLCRSSLVSDVPQSRIDLVLLQAKFRNGPQGSREVEHCCAPGQAGTSGVS